MQYSVVIPAFNEESRITTTLTRILGFMKDFVESFEIIVVDDGSSDETVKMVTEYSQDHPEVSLIANPHRGKGYAVRTGVLVSKGDLVLMADADMATPIDELKRLAVWIEDHDFDIVVSSREGVGATRHNEPLLRHIMGRVFNMIIRMLTRLGIQDTQNGFKLFKGDIAREIFGKLVLFGSDSRDITIPRVSAFDVEVLVVAKRLGYEIKEIPITWTYVPTTRVHPIRDSFLNFWDVIRIKANDMKGRYGK